MKKKIAYVIFSAVGLLSTLAYAVWERAWMAGLVGASYLACYILFECTEDDLEALRTKYYERINHE